MILRYELNTGVSFAVIPEETITVTTVAAHLFNQPTHSFESACLSFNACYTSFFVNLTRAEKSVVNLIPPLRVFRRSEDAYRAAREP